MTLHIGYAHVTSATPDFDAADILIALGAEPLCAWLENPQDPRDGLCLRDNIDPQLVRLQRDGVLIPEPSITPDAPARQRLWPQGRLFNTEGDLRWERQQDGSLYFVLIAAIQPGSPFDSNGWVALNPIDDKKYRLLLWGTKDSQGWSEGRIPHVQRFYPPHWKGPRAAIVAMDYEAELHYAASTPPTSHAEWQYAADRQPGIRVVTRYLGYDSSYTPHPDPRFI